MTVHQAFGRVLRTSRAVPGLESAPRAAHDQVPDIDIAVGQLPVAFSEAVPAGARQVFPSASDADADYPVTVHAGAGDRWYHFRYADGTRFVLRGDGGRIWMHWRPPLTLEDAATYLLGPVMAFALRLQSVLCLHASAVMFDGDAAVVCGPPGAGKSTTAAALALAGHRVLTDDVAPVLRRDDHFDVVPAYPQVRLWEPAARALFGRVDALPRLTPTWEKRGFDTCVHDAYASAPARLRAIFLLGEREACANAPRLESVPARDAFVALLANLHTTRIVPARAQRAMFELARDLVHTVPVQRLVPHAALERLFATCELLREAIEDRRCTG